MVSPKTHGQRSGWGGAQSISQQRLSEASHVSWEWTFHVHLGAWGFDHPRQPVISKLFKGGNPSNLLLKLSPWAQGCSSGLGWTRQQRCQPWAPLGHKNRIPTPQESGGAQSHHELHLQPSWTWFKPCSLEILFLSRVN